MRHLTAEERENLIRLYAYHRWEIRQKYGIVGNPTDDWQLAEIMVENEHRIENPK